MYKVKLAVFAATLMCLAPIYSQDDSAKQSAKAGQITSQAAKTVTLEFTVEEAAYVAALLGRQPTESGAFNLWLKVRKQIESLDQPAPAKE
jgi:hypothetical protein